jgi:peptidoglycan/xylan/chitin deacetylase (PgdA/CDA1 family)
MRNATILGAAATAAVTVGFLVGWLFSSKEPAATALETKIADRDLVTGTIPSRATAMPPAPQPQALLAPQAAMSPQARTSPQAYMAPAASPAALPMRNRAAADAGAPRPTCRNPDALGIARTVEIDTTGGPGFGAEQFKAHDFLEPGEVVLTFDDGPWPGNTAAVLAALAAQCVKATFFPIGKHASWHPEILKQVVAQGHTIGSHTWSHVNLAKKSLPEAKDEIENGVSAVSIYAGRPVAPFFRFPGLSQTPELTAYLAERNIGIFSADLDSFDFKLKNSEKVITGVMAKLKTRTKGIVLMHDFQHSTAVGLPTLLLQLKANGFKIVHMKAKDNVTTLPQYDAAVMKAQPGQTIDTRPTASVVRTISDTGN